MENINKLKQLTLGELIKLYNNYCSEEDEFIISEEIFKRTGIKAYDEKKKPFMERNNFAVGFYSGVLLFVFLKIIIEFIIS